MGRAFEKLSLADAVGRLRPGQKVLLPPGSAEPAAFIEELCRQADRLAPLTLMGGLLLGGYPFLRPEHARHFQWVTWQLMPPASAAWGRGQAHLGPAEREIAARVARLIPDGATIQLGVGSIPQAIMEALGEKRDLGVHSLLVDSVLPLIEKGVITNARKTLHPGRMDIGEAMGA